MVLNRQAQRQIQREMSKMENAINKLTPDQAKLIEHLSSVKAKNIADKQVAELSMLLDRNLSAALITLGFNLNQIDRIENLMAEFTEEDSKKYKELNKKYKYEEFEEVMKKIEIEIRKEIETLLEKGVVKKQAIEELQFKFPSLSRSMITNAYQKVKEEQEKKEDDIEIKEIEEFIFGEGKEMKKEVEKVKADVAEKATTEKEYIAENSKTINESTMTKDKENKKEVEVKGLRILEEKVIKTIKVEGANGYYEANTNKGVVLNNDDRNIRFENEEQLNEWVNEFKKVFAMVK